MQNDISDVLAEWEYEPGKNVRKIVGQDGKEKLQVRLPLGVEQYEIEGRPDGTRPHGFESVMAYQQSRLDAYGKEHGADEGFRLAGEDCEALRDEGLLYYYRYLLCFQIGEYDMVIRDTDRNLRMFGFVASYAERDEDRVAVEQYRPYIIRINATARVMLSVAEQKYDAALAIVRTAIRQINELEDVDSPIFPHERARSTTILKSMEKEVLGKKPLSKSARLEKMMRKAVEDENYERAAEIRDMLRQLGPPGKSS